MQRVRAITLLRFILAVGVLAAVVHVAGSTGSLAGEPARHVSVIDGDTLQVDGRIIQLFGIDAPELGQSCFHDGSWYKCGLAAAFELQKLIKLENATVSCAPPPRPALPSTEVCQVGDTDVAKVLLEGGYVFALPVAGPDYLAAQMTARQGRLGVWHTEQVSPAEWRAGERLPGEAAAEKGSCPVKGVVADAGRRLYYVPTDPGYDAIAVDPARGGRLFCSDEAARAAGWRRDGQTNATGFKANG
jgi:endonuclease YncB( thermonuclease family)